MAAAIAVSSCGGNEDTETGPETPKGLVEATNLDGVHSGQVISNLLFENRRDREIITVRLTGWFRRLGEEDPPQFQVSLSSQGLLGGREIDFNSVLILLPDQVVFSYGHAYQEKPYKPDKVTFEELKSKFKEAEEGGGKGDVMACLEAAEGAGFAQVMRTFRNEGRREDSDGTRVTLVGGEIDVAAMLDMLIQLAEDPDCASQMEAVGAPVSQLEKAKLSKAVRSGRITLGIDKNGLLRDIEVDMHLVTAHSKHVKVEFNYGLSEVNQRPGIFGASGRPFDVLLRKFGVNLRAALHASGEELVLGFLKGIAGGVTGRLP
jgi:hypothetical protein